MELIDFGPATATMRRLVLGTRDDQLGHPTPCTEYSVGDLIHHIGGVTLPLTGAAQKEAPPPAFPGAEKKDPGPDAGGGGSGDASRLEAGWRLLIARDLEVLAESWRNP